VRVRATELRSLYVGEGRRISRSIGPIDRSLVHSSHLEHVQHPPLSGIEERRPDPTWTTNWHIVAKLKHHNPGQARAGRGLWGFGSLRPVSTELFLCSTSRFFHVGKVPGNFRAAQVVRCVSVSRTFQGEGSMGPVARDVVLPLSHLKHVQHPPQSGIEERRPDPTWTTNWHIVAELKHHNPGQARAGRRLWGFGG
jgi:hypothetical protein